MLKKTLKTNQAYNDLIFIYELKIETLFSTQILTCIVSDSQSTFLIYHLDLLYKFPILVLFRRIKSILLVFCPTFNIAFVALKDSQLSLVSNYIKLTYRAFQKKSQNI